MGMNNKKVWLVALASIIFSGCSLFPQKTGSVELTKKEELKQAEKLAKIIERGGSADCKIVDVADNTKLTVMKVSGKKMRIEGQGFGEGEKKGFMINDGVYTYIWSDGDVNGYKTKLPEEQEIKDDKAKINKQDDVVPPVQVGDYEDETRFKVECKEGKIAESEFIPPSTVKFIDPSEMMKGLPGLPAGALDQLPK